MHMSFIKPFKFWCQKVLPLVYDDSLSYYEVLCKIVHYINELIKEDARIIGMIGEQTSPYINVKDFGAVGDGETDDTAAFQKAIDFCADNDQQLMVTAGRYLISETLVSNKSITITGDGIDNSVLMPSSDLANNNGPVISIKQKEHKIASVISNGLHSDNLFNAGDHVLRVSGTNLSVKPGDIIRLAGTFATYPWVADNRGSLVYGETNFVESVAQVDASSVDLTLREPLAFTIAETVDDTPVLFTVEYAPALSVVSLSKFSIEPKLTSANNRLYNGILIEDCAFADIHEIKVSGCGNIGIQSAYSYMTNIHDCVAVDCYSLQNGSIYATGYGLRLAADRSSVITNCRGTDCRHFVDISGDYPAIECEINSNTCSIGIESAAVGGINTHGTAYKCKIVNNIVNGFDKAIQIGGEACIIDGNKCNTRIQIAFGSNHIIKNNDALGLRILTPDINDSSRFIVIEDNTFRDANAVNFASADEKYDTVYGFCFTGNKLVVTNTTIGYWGDVRYSGATEITFTRGTVIKNNYAYIRRGPSYDSTTNANVYLLLDTSVHKNDGQTVTLGVSQYDRVYVDEST